MEAWPSWRSKLAGKRTWQLGKRKVVEGIVTAGPSIVRAEEPGDFAAIGKSVRESSDRHLRLKRSGVCSV